MRLPTLYAVSYNGSTHLAVTGDTFGGSVDEVCLILNLSAPGHHGNGIAAEDVTGIRPLILADPNDPRLLDRVTSIIAITSGGPSKVGAAVVTRITPEGAFSRPTEPTRLGFVYDAGDSTWVRITEPGDPGVWREATLEGRTCRWSEIPHTRWVTEHQTATASVALPPELDADEEHADALTPADVGQEEPTLGSAMAGYVAAVREQAAAATAPSSGPLEPRREVHHEEEPEPDVTEKVLTLPTNAAQGEEPADSLTAPIAVHPHPEAPAEAVAAVVAEDLHNDVVTQQHNHALSRRIPTRVLR